MHYRRSWLSFVLTGLALAAVLSGCAEQVSRETRQGISAGVRAVAQSDACCRALSALAYEPLTPGKPLSYDQSTNLDVIEMDTGASHAKGFLLDAERLPGSLEIRTEFAGFLLVTGAFMIPSVLILDEQFAVIEDVKNIRFSQPPPERWASIQLEGHIFFDRDRHAAARYLVFYFDASKLGVNYTICSRPGTSFFGPLSVPIDPCIDVPASHTGKLRLTLNQRRN